MKIYATQEERRNSPVVLTRFTATLIAVCVICALFATTMSAVLFARDLAGAQHELAANREETRCRSGAFVKLQAENVHYLASFGGVVTSLASKVGVQEALADLELSRQAVVGANEEYQKAIETCAGEQAP